MYPTLVELVASRIEGQQAWRHVAAQGPDGKMIGLRYQ
jgi:hypothetical protein